MSGQNYIRELWEGKRSSFANRLLVSALSLLSVPYGAAVSIRAVAYRAGILPVRRLARPVVSVGNLTVGGTGKTPMVSWLARLLISQGKRVCVLSRGYGGTLTTSGGIVSDGERLVASPTEAGDEPFLLASSVGGLMVAVGADRYRTGLLAQKRLDPDVFILDDGFQHIRLHRDLNILLLDSSSPFGNKRLLPAGSLREPVTALQRADLAVFTRWSAKRSVPDLGLPSCRAVHRLQELISLSDGRRVSFAELGTRPVAAFAGIADPSGFFAMLQDMGLDLVAATPFPDHVTYGDTELLAIRRLRETSGASLLITTEKDAVKLAAREDCPAGILAARLEMELLDPEPLLAALAKLL
jgi:tetraacyldisaccharide 4'-kinase